MGLLDKLKGSVKKFNFLIILVVLFGVYVTCISDYNYSRVLEYDKEIKTLKAQIKQCEDSTAVYRQRLKMLDSDPETLERIVREEYLMKRDNEDLYIVNE